MSKIHVIIPAAGSSSRMGQDIPKQFASFHGKTLIEWVDFIFSNVTLFMLHANDNHKNMAAKKKYK